MSADFEFDAEVMCDACQGSGEVERDTYGYYDPNAIPIMEPCAYCDGTGGYMVHMRPVDLEDVESRTEEERRTAIYREVKAYADSGEVGSSHWINSLVSRLMVVTK